MLGVWAQQVAQDAEGARAGERISGGWECRRGAPFEISRSQRPERAREQPSRSSRSFLAPPRCSGRRHLWGELGASLGHPHIGLQQGRIQTVSWPRLGCQSTWQLGAWGHCMLVSDAVQWRQVGFGCMHLDSDVAVVPLSASCQGRAPPWVRSTDSFLRPDGRKLES